MASVHREGELSSSAAPTEPRNEIFFSDQRCTLAAPRTRFSSEVTDAGSAPRVPEKGSRGTCGHF